MLAELPQTTHIRYDAGLLQISGPVSRRLRITAQAMLQNLMDFVGDRSIDLICIAAGAYALDRITKRTKSKNNAAGIRCFPVRFHVSDARYWSRTSVGDKVAEILNFLTGDHWLVSFEQHNRVVAPFHQSILALNDGWRPSHVALYSGGLDSAAGLASQLQEGKRDFVLLTAGHQSSIRRRALDQVEDLKRILPNAGAISHASFVLHLEGAGRLRAQETTQRARGFLFCTSAAILAAACSVRDVAVYENGHGAINLPLAMGSLTDGYSTRGAHPAFLRKLSELVSDALETEITFQLPFFGDTKAELVARLMATPGVAEWAMASRSCVHTSLRESGVSHCGECMACIERHQAFVGAGLRDDTSYSQRMIWRARDPLANDFLRSHLDSAKGWLESCQRTLSRFEAHRVLSDIEGLDREAMVALHKRHAAEAIQTYGHLALGDIASEPRGPKRAVA